MDNIAKTHSKTIKGGEWRSKKADGRARREKRASQKREQWQLSPEFSYSSSKQAVMNINSQSGRQALRLDEIQHVQMAERQATLSSESSSFLSWVARPSHGTDD